MREQADVLDDVAGPAPERDRIPFANVAIFNANPARIRLDEAIDQAKERGFSRSAAADERYRFARANTQGDVMQDTSATSAR
jgi:hypothetical protein